jgi:hypothetical protein
MIFPYLKVVFLTIFRKFLNGKTYFSHANMYFSQNLEKSLHHSEDNYERIHTVCHDCVWNLFPVDRKKFSKTAKNHLRKLKFCLFVRTLNFCTSTLHPGLAFFKTPPAAGA